MIQGLLNKRKLLEEEYQRDKSHLEESIINEQNLSLEQIKRLNHSLNVLKDDNEKLQQEISRQIEQNSKSEEVSQLSI